MVEQKRSTRLYVSTSKLLMVLLMLVLLMLILVYYGIADPQSTDFVTYDSISYRSQAIEHCAAPLVPVEETIGERNLIDFNWTTIVSIGASLCSLNESMLDMSVLILNVCIMLLTVMVYRRSIDLLRLDRTRIALFAMLYMMQLYYLVGVISLNKEVFGFLSVAVFLYLTLRGRLWLLLVFALLFGLIKIQYLMLGVYLFFVIKGVRNRYMLVAMSLVLSLIYQFTDMSIFNLDVYYSRFDYPITTEAATRMLNEIVAYPFGYLLVLPARFLITIAAGLNPLSIDAGSSLSLTYYVSSLLFCGASLMMFHWVLVSRVAFDNLLFKFIVAYIAVMGMVPFIQLRYFLPLTPVIIMLFMTCRFPRQFDVLPGSTTKQPLTGAG